MTAAKKRSHRARRPGHARPARSEMSEASPQRVYPDWRWRTFPVFAAFVAGLLVASFVNGAPSNTVAAIVQVGALLGLGYVLAHLFVMNVIVAGRLRRRQEAVKRGETPPDEVEDVVVYPGEEEGGTAR